MRVVKTISKIVFGSFFVFAGVMHFVNSDFFLRIMPPYLPWHLEIVYLSGVFEIALGALLWIPKFTRLAAWGLVALLIAVFPANIHVFQHQEELFPETPAGFQLMRLLFQGVFILWAYWYTTPASVPHAQSSAGTSSSNTGE
jgi:uncharacterized membrane protein